MDVTTVKLVSQAVNRGDDLVQAFFNMLKPLIYLLEAFIYLFKSFIYLLEAFIYLLEAPVNLIKPAVNIMLELTDVLFDYILVAAQFIYLDLQEIKAAVKIPGVGQYACHQHLHFRRIYILRSLFFHEFNFNGWALNSKAENV